MDQVKFVEIKGLVGVYVTGDTTDIIRNVIFNNYPFTAARLLLFFCLDKISTSQRIKVSEIFRDRERYGESVREVCGCI